MEEILISSSEASVFAFPWLF